jgi:ATP-dependent Clp protease ATP-binding subunit ClpA
MTENLKRMQNIVGTFMEKSLKIPAYEGLSKAACIAIFLSREEAKRLQQRQVDEETFLLGLLSEEHGIASQTLKAQGVTLKSGRAELDRRKLFKNPGVKLEEVTLSDGVEHILFKAQLEAQKMFMTPTDTEHLLLALMDKSEEVGSGRKLLETMGVDCDMLRSMITGSFDD